jgi:hypothetical protein
VVGGDVKQAAFTAGLGALVSEVVASAMIDPNELGQRAVEKATAEGLPMTKETLTDLVKEDARGAIDLSRLSAGVIAMVSGQDVDLAVKAATNAVENNLLSFVGREALKSPAVIAALEVAKRGGAALLKKAGDVAHKAAKMVRAVKSAMDAVPEEGSGGSGAGDPDPDDEHGKDHEQKDGKSDFGEAFPDRDLPRDKHGRPTPDPEAAGKPHTQLGTKESSKGGKYPQAREFDGEGNPVRDIDFTDHGRPQNHPSPHVHDYLPSSTGGTLQLSKLARPLE